MANEKHDVRSFHGLAKRENDESVGGVEVAVDLSAFNKPQVDDARMRDLAQPRSHAKYQAMAEMKAQEERANQDPDKPGAKEAKIEGKLRKSRKIDFGDYIDRDVPHIAGDGQFARNVKTGKGLADFATGKPSRSGLFEDLVKEAPKGTLDRDTGEALTQPASKGPGSGTGHLPNYLQAARQVQHDRAEGNKARMRGFRKAMNNNVVREMGL